MRLQNSFGVRTVLIVLVVVAMAPIFFVVVRTSVAERSSALEKATITLRNRVQLIANTQHQLFEGTRHMLTAVAYGGPMRNAALDTCSEYLRGVNGHFPQYANLGYADIKGKLVCRSISDGRPLYVGDRDYFHAAVRTRGFTVSQYMVGRVLGAPVIAMSLPVFLPSGEVSGVQYAVLDLNVIQRQFGAVSTPPGMTDVVTDAAGVVLASAGEREQRVGERLTEEFLLQATQRGTTVTGKALDSRGREWLYAVQPVRPEGAGALVVASMMSTASVFGPAIERLRAELLVLLAIALVASLLAWGVGHRLLALPIDRLLAKLRKLEQGDHESVEPMEAVPVHELRRIDRGVSDLALALVVRSRQRDGALADLLEQKHALEASEQRYRAQFETSPQPMWVFDLGTLAFLIVNDAAVMHYGYSREEFLKMTLADIRPPEDIPALHERVRKTGFDRQDEVLTRHRRKNGEILHVEIASHMIDWGGRPARTVIAYDATSRLLAEQSWQRLQETLEREVAQRTRELELANGELEAFSCSVSHDLRGPLHIIDKLCAALLDRHSDVLPREASQQLEQIRAGTVQMNALIADLLSFARTGREPLVRQRVDLAEIAADVVAGLRRRFPERQLDVDIEMDLAAFADPGLLTIVFENLIGNAWKFTSRKSHAKVRIGRADGDGSAAVFVVADNGAGFDQAHAAKLFKPFGRLHPAWQFDGTGIGLATVYRIIHRHGGRVWAESELGEGASFYVALPQECEWDGQPDSR